MPPPAYKDIPAYKSYATFPSRPSSIPVWPKDKQGKHIIESGELMCRYEFNGAICPNTARFKSRQELGKHIRAHHDSDKVVTTGGRAHHKQYEHLVIYYEGLVDIMRGDSLAAQAAPENPSFRVIPNAPQLNDRDEGEGEDGQSDNEDEEDDAIAAPDIPNSPLPVSFAPLKSYGVTLRGPAMSEPDNTPAFRLPKSMQKKNLHDDWDPELLRKVRAENAKVFKRATSDSRARTLTDMYAKGVGWGDEEMRA